MTVRRGFDDAIIADGQRGAQIGAINIARNTFRFMFIPTWYLEKLQRKSRHIT